MERRQLLAANPIVLENQLPGNPQSEWDIFGAGDTTLQGYATDISVNVGQTVHFKVDDKSLASFHIDVYRMGYYGGMGARKVGTVATSQTIEKAQSAPLHDSVTGLLDAGNWTESASWAVPAGATSGIYFAKLVREDTGGASHIFFIVRNDASHSDLLFQTSDSTWQAYNDFGGNSVYVGTSGDVDDRAVEVSYNRPLVVRGTAGGLGDYNSPFHSEYPMVRWLEANGYDVSYFTDVDSDRSGGLIKNHKAFLSVGHDEYWSGGQRANVEAARESGVNMAFFSGNEVFWKTRWIADTSGTTYRTMVVYKESKANAKIDPSPTWTGTWRDDRFSPPSDGGRPENALTGTAYMNDRTSTDIGIAMQVPAADGKLRFWRNTPVSQLAPGQVATIGDRVVGYETDEDLDNGFRPAGLIDMSSTTFNSLSHVTVPWGTVVGPGTSTHKITLYRAASGALVFGAGTVQWSWGLDGSHDNGASTPDPSIRQATVNLFADMGVPPQTLQPGLTPATASTDAVDPVSMISWTPPSGGVTAGVPVTITGTASDVGGLVGGVEVSTDGGRTWHPAVGRNTWTYTWTPGTPGPVKVLSRASDDSLNLSQPSAPVNVTVKLPPTSTTGLVAAYDFNEGTGTTLTNRATGAGNGILNGPTWTTAGVFGGGALSFDGINDWVTVPDSAALDLTNGMTLESWVKPSTIDHYTTVMLKEGSSQLSYSLYASDGQNRPPVSWIKATIGGDENATGTSNLPLNTWTHLAATFDGSDLLLYVNGVAVDSEPVSSGFVTSTGVLRIGGNSIWGEYFGGLIDEMRIYNRALTQGEILSDMSTPIGGAIESAAPTGVAVTAPAAGSAVANTVTVTATASDNVVVAGVQFLLNGQALGVEDTVAPYSATWDTRKYLNGTYALTAVARDAAGNTTTSPAVSVTVNNPADTLAPTVSVQSPDPGALLAGPVILGATAADNISVVGVQFTLNGVNVGPEDTVAPYRVAYDFSSTPSGSYTLAAVARDAAGNTTSYPVSITVDSTAPLVTARTPAQGSVNVSTNVNPTATFSEDMTPGTIVMVLRDPAGNVVPSTAVQYNAATHKATLAHGSALTPAVVYTVTVESARDLAGNNLAAPVSWSFTTADVITGATIFGNAIPATESANDTNPVELGVRFRASVSGRVTGLRFYKGGLNTGTHVGHLWTASGTLLGTLTFSGETVTGWQSSDFATPIQINAGTTYVASYFSPNGGYALTGAALTGAGVSNPPLRALADGEDGPNGAFVYSAAGGFPNGSAGGTSYSVDVLFGTSEVDTTAPVVSAKAPASGATNVNTFANVTVTFSESVRPDTIGFELRDAGGALVPATVTYNDATRTATLNPSATMAPTAAYTATVSGAQDASGNALAESVTWSFTTGAAAAGSSIWNEDAIPAVQSDNDTNAVEVGLKVRSDVAGYLTGLKFFKGAANTGTHVGHLWTSAGALLATVTFADESPSGWQMATFDAPVAIAGNTTYVASYYAPAGHYSVNTGYFTTAFGDGPVRALANGTDGGNGVFRYGSGGGFPNNSGGGSNYWVDVLFANTIVDTTAPTITGTTPAAGTTDVSRALPITSTFSETVQPGSVSFVLRDASNNVVAASVSYDAATRTATLTPAALLGISATYTATVSGAADTAGNVMAGARTWSFTTGAATLWSPTMAPATPAANDGSAVEVGLKFRSTLSGYVTGVRFYKGAGNTGTHVGHLWTASGTLLAEATFVGETAGGWQQVMFSSAVPIAANTTYVISYHAPVGHYAADAGYFASSAFTTAPLRALAAGEDGPNGVYGYGAVGTFPTSSFSSTNYWVAPVFDTSSADPVAPTVTSRTPGASATAVPTGTTVSATFSEPVQPGTIGFVLRDAANSAVDAQFVYSPSTGMVTLTPTSPLSPASVYTATLSAAQDLAGNTMTTVTWSFTTAPVVPPSYSFWTDTTVPSVASVNDGAAVEVGVKFRSDTNGLITGIRFYKGAANTGTHVGHLWTAGGTLLGTATFSTETATGWQTATFSAPVAVSAGTTYVASYYAPVGGYAASAGYFATTGVNSGPVHALAAGVDGANGLYRYGTGGGFPTSSFNSSNYWVDVVFTGGGSGPAPSWTQTTAADFAAGSASSIVVTSVSGGELQLAALETTDDFNGATLGSSWTSTSWASAGGGPAAVTVAGGTLSVAGSQVLSQPVAPGGAVEGSVSFGAAYQHFGLATNVAAFAGNYWAMFSTGGTSNTLFARVNASGTTTDVNLGALPAGLHTYRVQPTAGGFDFVVDGVLKTSVAANFPAGTPLRAVLSAFSGSPAPALQAAWVKAGAYAPSGTFVSSVYDAGSTTTWGVADWNATLPAGTSVLVETSTSDSPTGGWSAWSAVTDGGTIASPAGRYLRYRITLLTGSWGDTPTVIDITFTRG